MLMNFGVFSSDGFGQIFHFFVDKSFQTYLKLKNTSNIVCKKGLLALVTDFTQTMLVRKLKNVKIYPFFVVYMFPLPW